MAIHEVDVRQTVPFDTDIVLSGNEKITQKLYLEQTLRYGDFIRTPRGYCDIPPIDAEFIGNYSINSLPIGTEFKEIVRTIYENSYIEVLKDYVAPGYMIASAVDYGQYTDTLTRYGIRDRNDDIVIQQKIGIAQGVSTTDTPPIITPVPDGYSAYPKTYNQEGDISYEYVSEKYAQQSFGIDVYEALALHIINCFTQFNLVHSEVPIIEALLSEPLETPFKFRDNYGRRHTLKDLILEIRKMLIEFEHQTGGTELFLSHKFQAIFSTVEYAPPFSVFGSHISIIVKDRGDLVFVTPEEDLGKHGKWNKCDLFELIGSKNKNFSNTVPNISNIKSYRVTFYEGYDYTLNVGGGGLRTNILDDDFDLNWMEPEAQNNNFYGPPNVYGYTSFRYHVGGIDKIIEPDYQTYINNQLDANINVGIASGHYFQLSYGTLFYFPYGVDPGAFSFYLEMSSSLIAYNLYPLDGLSVSKRLGIILDTSAPDLEVRLPATTTLSDPFNLAPAMATSYDGYIGVINVGSTFRNLESPTNVPFNLGYNKTRRHTIKPASQLDGYVGPGTFPYPGPQSNTDFYSSYEFNDDAFVNQTYESHTDLIGNWASYPRSELFYNAVKNAIETNTNVVHLVSGTPSDIPPPPEGITSYDHPFTNSVPVSDLVDLFNTDGMYLFVARKVTPITTFDFTVKSKIQAQLDGLGATKYSMAGFTISKRVSINNPINTAYPSTRPRYQLLTLNVPILKPVKRIL